LPCLGISSAATDHRRQSWAIQRRPEFEITVKNVSEKLLQFIEDERDRDREIHHGLKPGDEGYSELAENYRRIGRAALEFALDMHNRFIDFARVEKCQYWLSNRARI
jgi:hypothetical protein